MSITQTKKISVVAFGGGTGLSQLLNGLKKIPSFDITAIVAMSDDGGSSGKLRKSMGILPPGDVRNCLIALSELEPRFKEILGYRFRENEIDGHSFGNLFLAVLTRLTGSFDQALTEAHDLLKINGKVLPSVMNKVTLEAEHSNGIKTTGQARIARTSLPIKSIRLLPTAVPNPEVFKAIDGADILLFGPGSLYTSVLPCLLPKGIIDSVVKSCVKKVYVCNTMTQPGETTGFKVEDHLRAFDEICHERIISDLILNTGEIPSFVLKRYAETGSTPVEFCDKALVEKFYRVHEANLVVVDDQSVRHDSYKVAEIILGILKNDC